MKKVIWLVVFAAIVLCLPASAADTDPTNELKTLLEKVNVDVHSGKRTEAELSDDLKQFDAFLAEHKGEKTDLMARALYMKAALYGEVIGDTNKADALIKELKSEYSGTRMVAALKEQEARQAEAQKTQDALAVRKPFPDFNEKDATGKPLSISNYKGKVVMIDFWATWCPPCRGEVPNVVATYQKYHDKGFEIIGVSLDSDQQALSNFIQQHNMTWQQYFDGKGWSNKLATKYGIESIPATYLLDGNGIIIGKDLRGDDLTTAVAAAVANK